MLHSIRRNMPDRVEAVRLFFNKPFVINFDDHSSIRCDAVVARFQQICMVIHDEVISFRSLDSEHFRRCYAAHNQSDEAVVRPQLNHMVTGYSAVALHIGMEAVDRAG